MLVFHNDSDPSYANYAGNLSSMSSATTAVTLTFASTVGTSASNDVIVLTVTAGKEEAVMEALAGAFANLRAGMTVVADDKNSIYLSPGITALSSISVDNGAGTFKNVIAATFTTADTGGTDNAIVVTNANSGSVFSVTATTDASSVITLPTTPVTGFNAKFIAVATSGTHTITIAGAFWGMVDLNSASVPLALGSTSAVIATDDFDIGDWFEIVWNGSAYYITGKFAAASAIACS